MMPKADRKDHITNDTVQYCSEHNASGFFIEVGKIQAGHKRKDNGQIVVINNVNKAERDPTGGNEQPFFFKERFVTQEQECTVYYLLDIYWGDRVKDTEQDPHFRIFPGQIEEVNPFKD